MDDLVTRLAAANAEDERMAIAARDAWGPPDAWWDVQLHRSVSMMTREEAAFIEANGPLTILRRCAANRKIIDRHRAQRVSGLLVDMACAHCHRDDRPQPFPCQDLLDLAEGYGIQS